LRAPLRFAELGARALAAMDAETAHRLTVKMLRSGFGPRIECNNPRLAIHVAGLNFPNPLGLAAGFDKNAEAADAMLDLGFGFVEVGAVTPRAQFGNPRPRVFRLRADKAVINRYGFNNDGLDAVAGRLRTRRKRGIVGVNLGANKNSEDRADDYVKGVRALAGLVDFFTINISSPNTPGLRSLQDMAALRDLMVRVIAARDETAPKSPLFLKIAPDLTDEDKGDIAAVAVDAKIDGLIISNTTIERAELSSANADQAGGLSGKPLFAPSTALLAEFYGALKGRMPLIGVGGVFSARDAYEKIRAGAALVQLYTALVYEGPSLPMRILRDLPALLDADGFETVADAVGAGR